jgi:hypothetical protein
MNIMKKLGEKPGKEAPNNNNNLAYKGTDDLKHKQE